MYPTHSPGLLVYLLALCLLLRHARSNVVNSSTTLNFDDLSAPSFYPVYPPPARYHNIHFRHFSVFDPNSTALRDYLTKWDRNCAVSRPNALLGSRLGGDGGPKAAIEIAAPEKKNGEVAEAALSSSSSRSPLPLSSVKYSSFDLLGMTMKPLAGPAGDEQIRIYVKGYKTAAAAAREEGSRSELAKFEQQQLQQILKDDVVLWHVDFPVEYHLPFAADFPKGFKSLSKVEMWAEYGEQKLDWEFCIDDLKIVLQSD